MEDATIHVHATAMRFLTYMVSASRLDAELLLALLESPHKWAREFAAWQRHGEPSSFREDAADALEEELDRMASGEWPASAS